MEKDDVDDDEDDYYDDDDTLVLRYLNFARANIKE